ncbi:hypothetical protein MKX03_008996 [Papaver bracteatum]|nr:hypothetical protein MKX03_008996 [Papaver bracteatum]
MERFLPSELSLEILSRLPTDLVIQCREVCTGWRDLIGPPSDPHLHLQRVSQSDGNSFSSLSSHTAANVPVGLLFSLKFPLQNGNQIYYGEYQNQHSYKLRRVNQPPTISKLVVGSCNGLICFSETNHFGVHEPSCICNPVTSEYVNLPRLNVKCDDKVEAMVCGFGYHPSTNKYKIVEICYIQNQPLGHVKVYTLGSGGGWRDLGETAYSLRPSQGISSNRSPFGTLANGALHWLNDEDKIVSFDLDTENLYLLPSPFSDPALSRQNCSKLKVLGGCLCFVYAIERLDIWFLRKKGVSVSFGVNEQDDFDTLNWIKEFSIPFRRGVELCALNNDGEILLVGYAVGYAVLISYNPQTGSMVKLTGNEFRNVFRNVTPHVNTFVSLKALGEKCRFRKRYDVNPAPNEMRIEPQPKGLKRG